MPFSFSPNADHKINTTESNFVAPNILQRATIDDTDLVSSLLTNIFVFLVLVSIALFGYNFYLSNSITGKQAQISDYEKNLDIQDLDGVKSLSSRINVAKKIVDQFPFITTSFMVVSKSVENSIFYKSFNLSSDDKSNGYTLILSGVAPNYKSVIQQVDTFKSNTFSGNVSSVNVGSLSPDKTGNVNFSLSMNVAIKGVYPDPSLFNDNSITITNSTTTDSMIINSTTTQIVSNKNIKSITSGNVVSTSSQTTSSSSKFITPKP